MSPLRRIAACLNTSLESILQQVENHEPLANCVLHEIRRARAKARIQFARIKKESEQIDQKFENLCAERRAWVVRARESMDDHHRAIQCIKRLSIVEKLIEQVDEERIHNAKIRTQLASDLNKIEEKMNESRLEHFSANSLEDLDQVFERWEGKMAIVPSFSGTKGDPAAQTEALKTKLREVMAEAK